MLIFARYGARTLLRRAGHWLGRRFGLTLAPSHLDPQRCASQTPWWFPARPGASTPVRVLLADRFRWTLPDDPEVFAPFVERDIALVREEPADIVLLESTPGLMKLLRLRARTRRPRPFVIWTNEPRYATHFYPFYPAFRLRPDLHVMNCYTGDVWLTPITWSLSLFQRGDAPTILDADNFPALHNRRVSALMTRRAHREQVRLMRDGRDLDLCALREAIALCGHARGQLDIFGVGWPADLVTEESRRGPWHARKLQLLRSYAFNLTFENTNIPGYCSEKIWDAVCAGCLPVHYGEGNSVYDYFPRESFVDYCELGDPDTLFDYLERMPVEEYRRRYNRCVAAYQRVAALDGDALRVASRRVLASRLRAIADGVRGQAT